MCRVTVHGCGFGISAMVLLSCVVSSMLALPHFWHLDAVCLTVLVGLRLWVVPTWPVSVRVLMENLFFFPFFAASSTASSLTGESGCFHSMIIFVPGPRFFVDTFFPDPRFFLAVHDNAHNEYILSHAWYCHDDLRSFGRIHLIF